MRPSWKDRARDAAAAALILAMLAYHLAGARLGLWDRMTPEDFERGCGRRG